MKAAVQSIVVENGMAWAEAEEMRVLTVGGEEIGPGGKLGGTGGEIGLEGEEGWEGVVGVLGVGEGGGDSGRSYGRRGGCECAM